MDPLEVRLRNVVTRGEPPDHDGHRPQPRRGHGRAVLERTPRVVDFADFRRRQEAPGRKVVSSGSAWRPTSRAHPAPGVAGDALASRADQSQARSRWNGRGLSPDRCHTDRATRPRSLRSWPIRWAFPSNPCGSSRGHQRRAPGLHRAEAGPRPWPAGPRCTSPVSFAAGARRRGRAARGEPGRPRASPPACSRCGASRPAPSASPRWPRAAASDGCPQTWTPPSRWPSPTTAEKAAGPVEHTRRGRGGPRHRSGPHPARYIVAEDCGRADQPGDRRGPDPRGHRPRVGARAPRAVRLRRERTVPVRELHGLPAPDGDRGPARRDRASPDGPTRCRCELPRRRRRADSWRRPPFRHAIEDAISPFGAKVYEQHLPPSRILELIGAIEPAVPV